MPVIRYQPEICTGYLQLDSSALPTFQAGTLARAIAFIAGPGPQDLDYGAMKKRIVQRPLGSRRDGDYPMPNSRCHTGLKG